MVTFFEISTLEMWPDFMYAAVDSVGPGKGPIENNRPVMSLVFIIFIFITTFFVMNLFISVIVDKFNEEIRKREGQKDLSDKEKEWIKIQRIMVDIQPKFINQKP